MANIPFANLTGAPGGMAPQAPAPAPAPAPGGANAMDNSPMAQIIALLMQSPHAPELERVLAMLQAQSQAPMPPSPAPAPRPAGPAPDPFTAALQGRGM
jgi:hypothetical protein